MSAHTHDCIHITLTHCTHIAAQSQSCHILARHTPTCHDTCCTPSRSCRIGPRLMLTSKASMAIEIHTYFAHSHRRPHRPATAHTHPHTARMLRTRHSDSPTTADSRRGRPATKYRCAHLHMCITGDTFKHLPHRHFLNRSPIILIYLAYTC